MNSLTKPVPIRLKAINGEDGVKLLLGEEGREVDLIPSLRSLTWRVDGESSVVTIEADVDVDEIDFPVSIVQVMKDEVREMTARDWDRVIEEAHAGMATSVGDIVAAHLAGVPLRGGN